MANYHINMEDVPLDDTSQTPFKLLKVRSAVGGQSMGARYTALGQSVYPGRRSGTPGTHELHYHPHAEETIYILSGRGRQTVGDDVFEVTAGDVCFIPIGVPHKTEAISDEDLVMIWMLGGASTMEAAGYVGLE